MNLIILNWLNDHLHGCITASLALTLICGLIYHLETIHQAKMEKAVQLSQAQMENINTLQNQLDVSKQNAEGLKAAFDKAQSGQLQPNTHISVTAPSLPIAAQQVQDRINKQDTSLPPLALQKTDRTVVVQQPGNKDYQVGVYKLNNYRNWEWSTGYGQHGGDRYIPVELQRNFSKDAAVSVEYHYGGDKKGFEVKYTRKTDKLFGLF